MTRTGLAAITAGVSVNAVAVVMAAAAAAEPPISAERIREDVRVLASDEFEGRGPGEPGERRPSST